ncbi:MAG: adenylosuccinate lyase [Deltaproteobacteria bacterium]|nr:adenylosuccinate lyase [Deltaproteobacteria bacterium]
MITRYSTPEMVALWTTERRFGIMLEIELLACEAMEARGEVPPGTAATCRERAKFDPARVDEIEKTVKHDVIAFLTNVNEHIGEPGRHLHKGMTSSDVLDTALAVQLKTAGEFILVELDGVLAALRARAEEHVDTLCIGRSHGVHAEPTTFGWKLAILWDELRRGRERLVHANRDIAVGKISGAVGTFAHVHPEVEAHVCARLGLAPAPASNQVVQRDRHAFYFAVLALLATSIEKIAVEIRHLQRTEVLEAEEPFTPGQKGSSAMPHKRNPILSENLTGLARLMRGYADAAMENVALWHERDISHSSVERVIGPDATVTMHFMLRRLKALVSGLVVYPDHMRRNLEKSGGIYFSQRVLLALVEAGLSREEAYARVQKNAMLTWSEGGWLPDRLAADPEVGGVLGAEQVAGLCNLAWYVRHAREVQARVFGAAS